MKNSFVQQEAVQKLLRESAGLNVPGGNERFKAIVHRLLENMCTLIDDYNITEEEFWHAVNYLHELGGRQEARCWQQVSGWNTSSICVRMRSMPRSIAKPARRAPLKGRCMSPMRRLQRGMRGWMTVVTPAR
ncbi:Catechol 1,2-dioxygenase [Raoultella planticola]|uniref:Catechol 1,2-dioxygenase n=1 Tax=Raoultella planticola TaxID=575 RepID=A0A485D2A7_RAOPL|nr:Catechol 1,2-dioxygenase [Raoultella planticola]